jgi:hypothetical protein
MKYWLPVLIILSSFSALAQHKNVLISTTNDPNEPSIAVSVKDPSHIVAGANLDNVYISTDTGNTWTESRLSSAYGVWGDPIIITDTSDKFYYFHLSNPASNGAWIDRVVCQRLDNISSTWTNGGYAGLNGARKQDKQGVIFDPLTKSFYMSWTQFYNYGSYNHADSSLILFSKSTDEGNTWSPTKRISDVAGDCIDSSNTVEGAVPTVGPNGEVYVSWVGPKGIMFDRSTDGGNTWLPNDISVDASVLDWNYKIPGLNRCNGLPFIDCDRGNSPNKGNIYINWTDQRNGLNNTDVWLSTSTDGGNTWGQPVRVNNDFTVNHQFFSSMTIDQSTGYVYVLFYDRRNYSDDETDVYLAVSNNGGRSFSNDKISQSPFTPVATMFFGDYTYISAHNGIVRPIWGRMDGLTQSIYTAIIDTAQLTTGIQPENIFTDNEVAYPNPFAATTYLAYKLRKPAAVNLFVSDIYGRRVATLIDGEMQTPGRHNVEFNPGANALPAGIYYFHLSTNTISLIRKIVYRGE